MSPRAPEHQRGVGLRDTSTATHAALRLPHSIFPDALTGPLLDLSGGLITPFSVISRLHNYPIS